MRASGRAIRALDQPCLYLPRPQPLRPNRLARCQRQCGRHTQGGQAGLRRRPLRHHHRDPRSSQEQPARHVREPDRKSCDRADLALRDRFAIDGKLPISVLIVSVEACYMHCAKAFMRSALWKPDTWPDRETLPTLGQILADQIASNQSGEEVDEALKTSYAQTMW